jgi:hypothetical protein
MTQHQELREYLRLVSTWATEAAEFTTDKNEKENIQDTVERLNGSCEALINIIQGHERFVLNAWQAGGTSVVNDISSGAGEYDPHGIMFLWSAVSAAFHLGGRTIDNPISKELAKSQKRANVAHARKSLVPINCQKDAAVERHANELWKEKPEYRKKNMSRTTRSILDAVNRDLPELLGFSAVYKRVSVLKKRTTE